MWVWPALAEADEEETREVEGQEEREDLKMVALGATGFAAAMALDGAGELVWQLMPMSASAPLVIALSPRDQWTPSVYPAAPALQLQCNPQCEAHQRLC